MDSKHTKCTKPFLSSAQLFNQWAAAAKVDPHCDQELWRSSSEQKQNPLRTFTYMTLKAWLKDRLSNPQFESLLDSSLSATRWEDDKEIEDVWHGRVWQEFVNDEDGAGIFNQHSGNLVFSLYLDWFNAEGASSLGKHNSLGAITLVCLNLPPTQRYKVQNMFLFGIIPGPTEPSLEQVNHLLRPLVEELKLFWNPGHLFPSTASFPKSRMIRIAIFPLIADLPALWKTAGFGGHQATLFCSFCMLKKQDIEETDPSKFPPRDHATHLAQAKKWLETKNHKAREQLMKEHGARWSVLNELSYRRPIEYCSIEMMHSLILGNLKDHSLRFLSLASVGEKLSKMQEKDCEWQNDQSYTETPYTDTFGPKPKGFLKKGKGKRRRDDEVDTTAANQLLKRTRQQKANLPSGSSAQQTAPVPSTSGSRSDGQGSSSDHSSSHSYRLQVRK
jgi:hypothetical protein